MLSGSDAAPTWAAPPPTRSSPDNQPTAFSSALTPRPCPHRRRRSCAVAQHFCNTVETRRCARASPGAPSHHHHARTGPAGRAQRLDAVPTLRGNAGAHMPTQAPHTTTMPASAPPFVRIGSISSQNWGMSSPRTMRRCATRAKTRSHYCQPDSRPVMQLGPTPGSCEEACVVRGRKIPGVDASCGGVPARRP